MQGGNGEIGWKRDREEERAREREREGERRGAAQWPVVSVGLYGPVGAAARAVAGVCSTYQAPCVVVGLRVVSVSGATVCCRWSAVSVLGGRRHSLPVWWSVRVLVAALVLLVVVVFMLFLVLAHAVVVDAVACVVVVAVAVVRWW